MLPLLNEVFSMESTQYIYCKCHKEPCGTSLTVYRQSIYVAAGVVTGCNSAVHAPSVNRIMCLIAGCI